MSTRTQDEILARFHAATDDDWFGFRREVISDAMTLDTLCVAFPDADRAALEKTWEPVDIEAHAREYLDFAIGKILDHRGISASRSADKLREYAWLMGRDDAVAAMDAADYPQYGAPQVQAFADTMGWPFLDALDGGDRAELERMAAGWPCTDDCDAGCGS